jgi:hypothetical protein
MRPSSGELVRGVQGTLLTYILPHVSDDFARQELLLAVALLGLAAGEWEGEVQQLQDDNVALRGLLERGADALAEADAHVELAGELRAIAQGTDASARVPDLKASNDELRAAIGRLAVVLEEQDDASLRWLRTDVIDLLRHDLERRARSLLGSRADE